MNCLSGLDIQLNFKVIKTEALLPSPGSCTLKMNIVPNRFFKYDLFAMRILANPKQKNACYFSGIWGKGRTIKKILKIPFASNIWRRGED